MNVCKWCMSGSATENSILLSVLLTLNKVFNQSINQFANKMNFILNFLCITYLTYDII